MSSFIENMTGGLLGSSGPDYGGQAIKSEKRRQVLIDNGMGLINAVFGGGTAPVYTGITDKYTKDAWQNGGKTGQFFTIDPKKNGFVAFSPTGVKDPGMVSKGLDAATNGSLLTIPGSISALTSLFGSDAMSPREIANRRIHKGNLFTREDQTFSGFGNDFYNQRNQDYLNYAMPQLQRQYRDTYDSMFAGLANRGLLKSSVRDRAASDLSQQAGEAQQTLVDNGIAQEQQLRNDVNKAKENAVSLLYQTADPSQAVASASASAAQFRQPNQFVPIANMFANLANQYYMSKVLNDYRGTSMMPFNTGGSVGDTNPNNQ